MSEKKLSLSSINKQHTKEFGTRKKHILSNGEYILIDEKFKNTSIQQYIADLITILDQLKAKEIDTDVLRDITFVYSMLYLRHFTNLDIIPLDVEKMVIVCKKLIDLDLLEEIINKFDPKEIEKLNAMVEKLDKNKEEIGKQIGELFIQGYANELNSDTEEVIGVEDSGE